MDNIAHKLNTLIDNERNGNSLYSDYSLKNIQYLLEYYGNPHRKIKTIHVAGTNGKGSVSYMLNHIIIESGYKVGLYISPHLLKINERIKINNNDIPNDRLKKYIDELFQLLTSDNIKPTYFDALTLFAFRYFYDSNVDIAIIETGLGGRLDSTNVISPIISILTKISLDHRDLLGNSLQEIAYEKAGIIKVNSLVISLNQKKEVQNIISQKTNETSTKLFLFNRDFKIKRIRETKGIGFTFDFSFANHLLSNESYDKKIQDRITIKDIVLKNPCKFQLSNSTLAITSSLLLTKSGFKINENHIKSGLLKVKIFGRFHIFSKNPCVIFDPAHNLDALKELIKSLKDNFPDKKYLAVLSFMKDKDYIAMLKLIKKHFTDEILYYELNDNRCFKISNTEIRNKSYLNDIQIYQNLNHLTIDTIKKIKKDSLLLVTGTFRLFQIAKTLSSKIQKAQV